MDDITAALDKLTLLQMVLAWAFVACYALSLGGMLEPRGSRRAAVAAALCAVAFCIASDAWVHAALLVAFAVAGMGVFVAAAWTLSRLAAWCLQPGPRANPPVSPRATPAPRRLPLGVMLRALWRSQA